MTYHDDNIGFYEMRGPEDEELFHRMQEQTVRKRCRSCGRMVRIPAQHAYCNRCADLREQGFEIEDCFPEEETKSEEGKN